ncbi:MAG: NTP transferase domain-containing protein [Proteobacteria bacterium]|nr:NTP transferase domain-containing protein [Pseudomonadota bacterium]
MCIPARLTSERLPGKLLAPWGGHTVLEEVVDIGAAAGFGEVVVATDSDRIAAVAAAAGAIVARTSSRPRNGTERIAEAAADGAFGHAEAVINLQGDAVGATPALIGAVAAGLLRADLATVAVRSTRPHAGGRTTVTAAGGFATDFARRELDPGDAGGARLLHVGIYGYRIEALREAAALAMTAREQAESLEQLRWLDHGRRIALAVVDGSAGLAHAVDRPDDLR